MSIRVGAPCRASPTPAGRPPVPRTARTDRGCEYRNAALAGASLVRLTPAHPAGRCHRHRWRRKPTPSNSGGQAIDQAGEADQPGRQGQRHQQQRVEHDLPPRLPRARDHRQHRHAGALVIGIGEQSASAQKCGGVQKKMMANSSSGTRVDRRRSPPPSRSPAERRPAAPPMTMFCGVRRFSQIV